MLPYLATHLSFREIGERLYISRHTVKSQVMAVYRKLSVSSATTPSNAPARSGCSEKQPAAPAGRCSPTAPAEEIHPMGTMRVERGGASICQRVPGREAHRGQSTELDEVATPRRDMAA